MQIGHYPRNIEISFTQNIKNKKLKGTRSPQSIFFTSIIYYKQGHCICFSVFCCSVDFYSKMQQCRNDMEVVLGILSNGWVGDEPEWFPTDYCSRTALSR